MTKGRVVLLVVAAMVFLSVGFVVGQMVQAAGTIPGTAGDPLVAQSYVAEVVEETVASMQTKLDEMGSKVADLEKKMDDLSAGKGSSQPVSSGNSGSNTSSGTAKEPVNTPAKGKTVSVSGTSANVRTGPGTTYDKVATMVKGDTAELISEENGWYKVTLSNGKEGWIANWLVEVK